MYLLIHMDRDVANAWIYAKNNGYFYYYLSGSKLHNRPFWMRYRFNFSPQFSYTELGVLNFELLRISSSIFNVKRVSFLLLISPMNECDRAWQKIKPDEQVVPNIQLSHNYGINLNVNRTRCCPFRRKLIFLSLRRICVSIFCRSFEKNCSNYKIGYNIWFICMRLLAAIIASLSFTSECRSTAHGFKFES